MQVLGSSPGGRTNKLGTRFPALSAQHPPTQGHDRDMGTIQNTAALYLRKSSMDDRSGDNRSITDQRHDLERLADRHGLQIVTEYEEKVGTSASHIKNHDRPQYDRALADMGSTYEVLLAWRTDRLVRAGGRTTIDNIPGLDPVVLSPR